MTQTEFLLFLEIIKQNAFRRSFIHKIIAIASVIIALSFLFIKEYTTILQSGSMYGLMLSTLTILITSLSFISMTYIHRRQQIKKLEDIEYYGLIEGENDSKKYKELKDLKDIEIFKDCFK